MESKWAKPVKDGEETLFVNRMGVVEFLDKWVHKTVYSFALKV